MPAHIRVVCDTDVESITAIYRPVVESTSISFETTAPGADEIDRRVRDTLVSFPWLVCEFDGRMAGYAYATRHRDRPAYRWSVDTSVYIADGYRRRGVGRGLYLSLLAILEAQGYVNAYAGIALPNPASVALHEAVGFQPLGVFRSVGYKLGAWRDVGWWHRLLCERTASPSDPRDLTTMMQLPEWDALVRRGEAEIRADAR